MFAILIVRLLNYLKVEDFNEFRGILSLNRMLQNLYTYAKLYVIIK